MNIDYQNMLFPVQQIVSTSVGAIFTALLMTPFDVVRIRMQSENYPSIKSDCYVFRTSLGDHVCTCFDEPRTISWYNGSISGKYNGTIDAIFKIKRNEGIRSLWSGLSPTLVMSLPNTIIYYTTYEQLKCFMEHKKENLNPIIPGVAGGFARISAVTITNPLELIRTKKMSAKLSYADLSSILRQSVETAGLRSLWAGFVPTLWRDVPFSTFNFNSNFTLSAFYSGAIAGTIATIFTHPFDTIKSIQQVQLGNDPKQSSERTIKILHKMLKEQGIHSWYKGLVPRLLKVSPACAVMISTIEFFRHNVF